jgi:hypothetical protein
MAWIDLTRDRDMSEGSCEYGNESSGSITCWEINEWLRDWRLLRKRTQLRGCRFSLLRHQYLVTRLW